MWQHSGKSRPWPDGGAARERRDAPDLDLMALEGFRGKAGRHILPRDELRRPYAMVPSAEIAPGLRIEESGPTLLETKGGKSAQDLGLLPLTEPAPEGFPS